MGTLIKMGVLIRIGALIRIRTLIRIGALTRIGNLLEQRHLEQVIFRTLLYIYIIFFFLARVLFFTLAGFVRVCSYAFSCTRTFLVIGHVQQINILTLLRGFGVEIANFLFGNFASQFPKETYYNVAHLGDLCPVFVSDRSF